MRCNTCVVLMWRIYICRPLSYCLIKQSLFLAGDNDSSGRPRLSRRIRRIYSSDSDNIPLEDISNKENTSNFNLISALGADPSAPLIQNLKLNEEIANRWRSYLTSGVGKETRREVQERWNFPDNLEILEPPKINENIRAILNESDIKRDGFMSNIQAEIGLGLSALGTSINILIQDNNEKLTQNLADAGKCFSHAHYLLSQHRRHEILPKLNTNIQRMAKTSSSDRWLFGNDFTDIVKNQESLRKNIFCLKANTRQRQEQPLPFNRPHRQALGKFRVQNRERTQDFKKTAVPRFQRWTKNAFRR